MTLAVLNSVAPALPRVVMIHGLMESGKSTLASYFMGDHGYERVKFADPLKNMVRALLRRAGVNAVMIERYVEGDLKKTPIPELNDPTCPEFHLQNLGKSGVRVLLESMLRDCGMSDAEIADHIDGDRYDVPIPQLNEVTTAKYLFETLLNQWSREMLAGEIIISRRLMQTLGEEWRNLHSPRLWAKIARAKTDVLLAAGNRVIIDDNRYAFEFQEFTELQPFRFVVTRGEKHFQPITPDIHPGERPMPVEWFDFWIANDGSREALWLSAMEALQARAAFDHNLRSIRSKYAAAVIQLDVA